MVERRQGANGPPTLAGDERFRTGSVRIGSSNSGTRRGNRPSEFFAIGPIVPTAATRLRSVVMRFPEPWSTEVTANSSLIPYGNRRPESRFCGRDHRKPTLVRAGESSGARCPACGSMCEDDWSAVMRVCTMVFLALEALRADSGAVVDIGVTSAATSSQPRTAALLSLES